MTAQAIAIYVHKSSYRTGANSTDWIVEISFSAAETAIDVLTSTSLTRRVTSQTVSIRSHNLVSSADTSSIGENGT